MTGRSIHPEEVVDRGWRTACRALLAADTVEELIEIAPRVVSDNLADVVHHWI